MNKLCKIISCLVVLIVVISMTVASYAYTNDDVISYITQAHTVNGRTIKLGKTQSESLKQYLKSNAVTDSEANNIIAKLDLAKTKLKNSGVTNLSELNSTLKAEIVSLVKEAGAIAGLDVQVDTKNETVTIKDFSGKVIVSSTSYSQLNTTPSKGSGNGTSQDTMPSTNNSSKSNTEKLVYTGNDYSVVIKLLVAVVAVAIVGVIVKKQYAK